MMRVSLASTISDPLERLQSIRQSSAAAKATSASMKSVTPTDFPSLGAPWLISALASLFGRSRLANNMPPLVNVVISNVPGPKFALTMAGAKLLTYYPVSIAVHSVALNVTVQSYNGLLDFGLTACRKALPDLPALAERMRSAHAELLRLTRVPAADKEATLQPAEAPAPKHVRKTPQEPAAVPAKRTRVRRAVVAAPPRTLPAAAPTRRRDPRKTVPRAGNGSRTTRAARAA